METAGAVLRLIAIITGMSTASWLAYGGFCYVTASGNPRMIDRARTSIIAGAASLTISIVSAIASRLSTVPPVPNWDIIHLAAAATILMTAPAAFTWAGLTYLSQSRSSAGARKSAIILAVSGILFTVAVLSLLTRNLDLDWEKVGRYTLMLSALAAGGAARMRQQPGTHTGMWAAFVTIALTALALSGESAPHGSRYAAMAALGAHTALAWTSRVRGEGPLTALSAGQNSSCIGMNLAAAAAILITR